MEPDGTGLGGEHDSQLSKETAGRGKEAGGRWCCRDI